MMVRLLQPWLRTSATRLFPHRRLGVNSLLILILGLTLCIAIYLVTHKVLSYFHSQNELGVILSLKIFQMAWITIFAMLIFSSMVASVSTLYLSRDNEILLAAPLPPREIYLMRYITTSINTSWMILIFTLPVFGAYGRIFTAGPLFWPLLATAVPTMAAIASGFAMLLTVAIVYLFPARRTKDIILYLSLCFGIFLYLVFRMMRPEDLVNPEKYAEFIDYFSAISTPAGPWLPAGWAANMLSGYLLDRSVDWLLVGLLATTPLILFFLGEMIMEKLFMTGFSKSQESFGGHVSFRPVRRCHSTAAWIMRKEGKHFLRDSSEWSQFFMIGALVVVYLYNFKVLPLERTFMPTQYISNLIAFANIGLSGFLAASLAARFVYPSISNERGAFYLIRSAPFSLGRYLWYKYLFYLPPFTILALILVLVSNSMLQISGPIYWISLFTALLITWSCLGVALGFGFYFADFKTESRNGAMEPGAILYLFCGLLYQFVVIFTGFWPALRLTRRWLRHKAMAASDLIYILGWGGGMVVLSLLMVLLVCRRAISKMQR
ncbi:MAG: putative ABC transporter permease subunit [Desulforhopalus sp.]